MNHERRTILLSATIAGILFIQVPRVLWAQRGEVVISTLAGGGAARGDGDLAIRARLLRPRGVAVDREGNIYIADSFDELVRCVGPDGIITTYAGGVGFDEIRDARRVIRTPTRLAVDSNGLVYIADPALDRIQRVEADGSLDTFAGAPPARDRTGTVFLQPLQG